MERDATQGVILHWWLGDEQATKRALDLGCYFSVNTSSVQRLDVIDALPLDRVLTETDHPFGVCYPAHREEYEILREHAR